ncbi:hypothetical protein MCOR25_009367 [Pyricularia grisea]|uniref:Uncharacterized protein n=1 Tax=Pyricularia grisea TaxID=148305 RepID=A0A6P8BKY6_PYRGI|nr:uncharacterized protein PgNI_00230 [Pyricularia grisea]KAI6352580.1 hypothetical protein MCOR25_009367 [Pyricularia grisea]TLD17463.1 hypothetical protein PgNI_00230 [Pyricularia grisea]
MQFKNIFILTLAGLAVAAPQKGNGKGNNSSKQAQEVAKQEKAGLSCEAAQSDGSIFCGDGSGAGCTVTAKGNVLCG